MKNIKFIMSKKGLIFAALALIVFGAGAKVASAQVSQSLIYVPLIGITSVPDPLSLPNGAGSVTYHYAVKNFLQGVALTDVGVVDNNCSPVKFIEGDDNNDSKLDYSETWRFTCTTNLSTTTESIATATGYANDMTATHRAYVTVIVGSNNPAPLVSIINITKVAYPLSLPAEGGPITFTYRVNNPGSVPLGDVMVNDDKCSAMSGKLGDTNGNNLLDVNEVWIYTCTMVLKQTTTNTVSVTAYANSLKAVSYDTLTVKVDAAPSATSTSASILRTWVGTAWSRVVSLFQTSQNKAAVAIADSLFGWKFPVAKFPSTGLGGQLAYSDVRDPGGIPQGLPVRLQIPVIGVDSLIEDALITPDGRMDVPAGSVDVAWFALGPKPGEVGSAVIGGHYGIQNGVPFVFYKLDQLKVGDKVYIINDKGETLGFVVRSISLFNRNADATSVFTSNDGLAHLNLITCEGVWNQVADNYPDRRVVFTDAIAATGTAIFSRSLDIGAQGTDVATLQKILEQKGFLTMPSGVAEGFFGTLTGLAVAKYQTSVGLPSVGALGPLTIAKLALEDK